ncbi:MAG: PTS sugar transporter subunit IIA [Gemmatimonadota bacterium]|nr:MAG: PTS sugar transporter subunit IIA [Gemmatimonadota bacterium]
MENREFVSLFEENLFLPNLQARTKKDAIVEFVDLFVSQKKIKDKEILLEMLQQRESLGSTGIGKGIAIPHGRTLSTTNLIIAFGKSKLGIKFKAIDGKPVHLIFMIIAPYLDKKNRYLVVLGKLVELLGKKKIREKLLQVNTFQEFKDIIEGGKLK